MKKSGLRRSKGLSPVVATTLLVAMVIVLGLIVFLWFKSITPEVITKFGKNIELACDEVQFEASLSGNTLYISNLGNVPIYRIEVKIENDGAYETITLGESNNWPTEGLNQGGAVAITFSNNADKIILIPVLLGTSETGKATFTCNEKQYGYSILI